MYVTGITSSSDFPTVNALQSSPGSCGDGYCSEDAYVAALTANGQALRYSTYLGGSDIDYSFGIAVDAKGQAYVTGWTRSSDFPTAHAAFMNGGDDAFVAAFSADGKALLYSTYLGGRYSDSGAGIAVDRKGQVYVTGTTDSPDFPTALAAQPNNSGFGDAFVAKLTADGQALVYSTYLGGSGNDHGHGIAVDAKSRVYVTGSTESADFPTVNAPQPSPDISPAAVAPRQAPAERSACHGDRHD